MTIRAKPWLASPSLLRAIAANARLAFRLLREPRVSLLSKAVPVAALIYVVSPLDVVPDVLPFLGQIDDLGIIVLAIEMFLRLCPADLVTFHRNALASRRPYSPAVSATEEDFIDAEWRHE